VFALQPAVKFAEITSDRAGSAEPLESRGDFHTRRTAKARKRSVPTSVVGGNAVLKADGWRSRASIAVRAVDTSRDPRVKAPPDPHRT
jgi:hypothetical protein